MGIDRNTELSSLNIVFDDNKAYLNSLREQAEEDGQNDEKDATKKLSLTTDKHSFTMEEYYFDETDKEIFISGSMKSTKGEAYVSFTIPLSDIVLIDIIAHSLKKLSKLKTAMETLK